MTYQFTLFDQSRWGIELLHLDLEQLTLVGLLELAVGEDLFELSARVRLPRALGDLSRRVKEVEETLPVPRRDVVV